MRELACQIYTGLGVCPSATVIETGALSDQEMSCMVEEDTACNNNLSISIISILEYILCLAELKEQSRSLECWHLQTS